METNKEITENKPSNKKFALVFGVLLVLGGVYGGYKYINGKSHEITDDAQVEKNMSPIVARVGGFVNKIYVVDNQMVKKGDTLFTIDQQDYIVKLNEAEAALEAAKRGLEVSQAEVSATSANVAVSDATVKSNAENVGVAQIRANQAQNDYERYKKLYENHSITKQQYEKALTAKLEADKQVEVLKQQRNASNSQRSAVVSKTNVASKQTSVYQANIKKAEAAVEAAKLNLSYATVIAAVDGQITNVKIQPGQLINPGAGLFYIIDDSSTWLVANFKETQLNKMRLGQAVTVKVDAYPDIEFEGEINSFSPATGSKFSLLPPDNATGNFVKTVQRVPVKIVLSKNNSAENIALLRAGMNAEVDVHLK